MSISRFFYPLLSLWSLTDMLSVGTDISIRSFPFIVLKLNVWAMTVFLPVRTAKSVFVFRPTSRTNMAQGTKPRQAWHSQKCLGPRRHSPKKRHLRRLVIKITLRGGLKPEGTAPWGSRMPVKANLSAVPKHTRPDPCTDQHGRPRCVPA